MLEIAIRKLKMILVTCRNRIHVAASTSVAHFKQKRAPSQSPARPFSNIFASAAHELLFCERRCTILFLGPKTSRSPSSTDIPLPLFSSVRVQREVTPQLLCHHASPPYEKARPREAAPGLQRTGSHRKEP